ncbi:LytTR family DNA-binding domain-containing protein [Spirosoma sp.]|uniref:LytR/AlgR family response regulator transcription factor n=1 Tax=Spirosoma sp. TaxID=1899569 RepID=UPI002625774F|nr:LytTR family DNA-binding domain-containing protein [Spirosoma sp.]MCX6219037.1 LytTR family DNA-binding domain-containing protein [Spirosoma sp.]
MSLTIVVLEDEALAARQLVESLEKLLPDARMLTTLASVQEAMAWWSANPAPDLLFSDIELLDGNVFALFERVAIRCPIVFTTAYDQFLLRAFQGNGIAYLLKPFTMSQLQQALDKYALLRTSSAPSAPILTEPILAQLRDAIRPIQTRYRQRFTVKLRQGIHLLAVEDITYLQADEGVVFAFDSRGQKYPLNGKLTELEEQLDPAHFFRLNRSEIINIRYIDRLEPYFNDRLAVRMRGHAELLIASTGRTPDLRRWVDG